MRGGPAGQEDDEARDVLGLAEPLVGGGLCELLGAALEVHEAGGHLGRVEAGGDGVAGDGAGAELDGEVLGEVDDGGLGGAVAVGGVGAEGADAEPRDRGGHDHAAGVVDLRAPPQQRLQLLHRVEDALDVQVHHLAERRVRVGLEGLPPRRARVREQDVHVVGRLGDLRRQPLDLGHLGRVGGDGDGHGTRPLVRQGVEGVDRFLAGFGLARGYVDFGAAGLEETGEFVSNSR